MKKVYLDKYTKEQAQHYADTEAELNGFARGSAKWKKAFKDHLVSALSSMSVGRNPRIKGNPRELSDFPEIFSGDGFAGKVAHNFIGTDGKKFSLKEVQDRIKSSVSSLVYLYLGGIYGIKTTTKTRQQGHINIDEMSDLQLRDKGAMSSDEIDALNLDVIYNQFALTVVETCCYEMLNGFFTMSADDVQAILDSVQLEGKINMRDVAKARTELEKHLRRAVREKLANLKYKNLVLG